MLDATDPDDFRRIYDATASVIFKVAYRITGTEETAEDMRHDAYIRMYEKEMRFPSIDDAKYWLLRVIRNASLNYAKRKERERKAYEKALHEDRRQSESGEISLLKNETKINVQQALKKLPENLRAVLILKEYGELNYKEIGRILGITEGNVKVRMFRAREQLSHLIEESDVYVP